VNAFRILISLPAPRSLRKLRDDNNEEHRQMSAANDQQEIEQLRSRMLLKPYYVMLRDVVDRSKLGPAALAHFRWIIELEKQGKVFASGPLFMPDGTPDSGLTIFRTETADEAAELASGDPFFTSGAVTFQIRRWVLSEGRMQVHFDFSDQTYHFG
jgi:uncharacterized protein YciI